MPVEDILSPAAIQIHINLYLSLIQQVQQLGQRLTIPSATKRVLQVIMRVNHREARLIDLSLFQNNLRFRVEVHQS